MKKIIGIVFISLMFANIGFAEMRLIEEKYIEGSYGDRLRTVCVDGYKFVAWRIASDESDAISIIQFYEAGNNQSPKPAKC